MQDRQGGRDPQPGQPGEVDRGGLEASSVEAGQAEVRIHCATSHTRIIIIFIRNLRLK